MRDTLFLRVAAPLIALGFAGSCGGSNGGSPQGPSGGATPAPRALVSGTTVTIVSAEDEAPVGGARVILAGREYTSDGAGRVTLASTVDFGSFVDIIAEGFFNRQTVVPSDGTRRFSLWPRENSIGMSEEFTAQLVYTYGWSNEPEHGTSPLVRIQEGAREIYLHLSAEILQDEEANRRHVESIDEVNAALEGRATYVITATRPSGGVVYDVRLEQCEGNVRAFFRAWTNPAGEITRGEIVYCRLDVARATTVSHEIGHSIGLQHTYAWEEIMSPFYSRFRVDQFSPREALAMRLLFERPAGNRFPDSDREVSASAGGVRTIVCY